ncbi:MAG: hypothetical protein EZS28_019952 [Streblomastix strix]|uniref:RNase III domain-containing protein n=1 Tax=Streblomastix strix TaxID=222440 RepID=A0A5J4VPU6_9EUKA|nr:MAG: hypothetical protein EZS28_019952 [Streblomastix strix]
MFNINSNTNNVNTPSSINSSSLSLTPREILTRERDVILDALTTSSAGDSDDIQHGGQFERLEFLGDSVLLLITNLFLFASFPSYDEGQLTSIKSNLISNRILTQQSMKHLGGIHGVHLFFLVIEPMKSIADSVEAVIGASFLLGGFSCAYKFWVSFISLATKEEIAPAQSYERLEYLGDTIIALIIVERLYRRYPKASPALLTVLKHALVSNALFALINATIGLSQHMRYNSSVLQSEIHQYESEVKEMLGKIAPNDRNIQQQNFLWEAEELKVTNSFLQPQSKERMIQIYENRILLVRVETLGKTYYHAERLALRKALLNLFRDSPLTNHIPLKLLALVTNAEKEGSTLDDSAIVQTESFENDLVKSKDRNKKRDQFDINMLDEWEEALYFNISEKEMTEMMSEISIRAEIKIRISIPFPPPPWKTSRKLESKINSLPTLPSPPK